MESLTGRVSAGTPAGIIKSASFFSELFQNVGRIYELLFVEINQSIFAHTCHVDGLGAVVVLGRLGPVVRCQKIVHRGRLGQRRRRQQDVNFLKDPIEILRYEPPHFQSLNEVFVVVFS